MYDVMGLGEVLIDFTPAGQDDRGRALFARNPGSAVANVVAMNALLGGCCAFTGKVGDDSFGRFLRDSLTACGVDCRCLCVSRSIPTTLAFVHPDTRGDRSFTFYRKPGADILLEEREVSRTALENCRFFHFGGVSLTDEPLRSAALSAVSYARAHGALISYDPNYRAPLWHDETEASFELLSPLSEVDILKVSDEEMTLLTGVTDLAAGAEILADNGPALVLVTLGERGAFYFTRSWQGLLPAFSVSAVDITGAGDAFLGALLFCLRGKNSREELEAMTQRECQEAVRFAVAAGSLTTTAAGAISAMPSLAQIRALADTVI